MPSKSPKQARLMAACAHGANYKNCPPARVAKEFNQADKGTGILSGSRRKARVDPAEGTAADKREDRQRVARRSGSRKRD